MKHAVRSLASFVCNKRNKVGGVDPKLKIALIADELTQSCLALECEVRHVTPFNASLLLNLWKPDVLFVESAWQGRGNSWKYKIAAYPDRPERNNRSLQKVVGYARSRDIPCVFWNKEDGVHFERFISSAALFDYIFTVDENCIPRYRAVVGPNVRVAPLMFAVQPAIHSPSKDGFRHSQACFVGSYSLHIHDRRRKWQQMLFAGCSDIGLKVFDRNSGRRSSNYRYPDMPWLEVRPSVPHTKTGEIYRDHMVSLNVNTVEDSATMFSRRLIEILACGGLAVTTPALSVDRHFKEYCHVVHSEEEARDLLGRLKHGLTARDREMAAAGADYMLREFTWTRRLGEVMRAIS